MVFCSALLFVGCGSSNGSGFNDSLTNNGSNAGIASGAWWGGGNAPVPGPGTGNPVTFTPDGNGPGPGPGPGPAPESFLYLANPTPNGGGGWITTLGVAIDGLLSVVEAKKDNPGRPLTIGRSPDGQYVYAVNVSSEEIVPYVVTQGTGLLTPNGPRIPAGYAPRGLTFTPNQAYAYTSGFNGAITGFSVLANGRLEPLLGFPVASGTSGGIVVVGPDGTHLYAPNEANDTIGVYEILGTGALTSPTQVPAGDRPYAIAFPAGLPFAYVTNGNDGTLSAYQVVSGNLSPLSPPSYPTGAGSFGIKAHPTLPVVYAVSSGDLTVNVFSVDPGTGALTLIDSDSTGSGPGAAIIDPSGRFMYIPSDDYYLTTYQIAADGTLTRTADFVDSSISFGFVRDGVSVDNTLNRSAGAGWSEDKLKAASNR